MVTAEESQTCQQISARNSKDSNLMKLLIEQNCSFLAFPEPKNGVAGLSQVKHTSLGVLDKPVDAPRKKFIIFDRSGNRTRFFVGPSFSCQDYNIYASKAPATTSVLCGKVASEVEEKWDENNLSDGEGDQMLEDAEGIDALLYSDSDDDDDGDDDDDANDGTDTENDEVSSTRHTPLSAEDWEDKGESLERVVEQVDGSPKRQKLLDGSCKKPSFGSNEGLVEGEGASSCDYNDDVAYSSKNEKKVKKIDEALEVLGGIIPGLKSKDPLSIIEKAIVYLERMKIKAMALGVEVSV